MRTREEKLAYAREYYKANKEKLKVKRAEYYDANKESFRIRHKKHLVNCRDSFYTLYYLPEHHYIGVTNQPKTRARSHRASGRVTRGFEVVAVFETKREALDAEFCLHKIGYYGKHKNRKI